MAFSGTMAGGGGASTGGGLGWLGNLGGLFGGGGFKNIANPTPLQMGEQINRFMDAQKMQQMFSGLGVDGMGLMNMGYKLLAANQPTTDPSASGLKGLMGDMDMSDLMNLKKAEEATQTGETPLVEIEEDTISKLPPWINPQVQPNPNMLADIMKAKSPMYQSEADRGWGYRDNDIAPINPMFREDPYYPTYGRYGGGY
jgi:hypothetical protein|tara:strand:- start:1785 stop:2381 length:597 start_codon:yes stop_codon:yes gene_type:complete